MLPAHNYFIFQAPLTVDPSNDIAEDDEGDLSRRKSISLHSRNSNREAIPNAGARRNSVLKINNAVNKLRKGSIMGLANRKNSLFVNSEYQVPIHTSQIDKKPKVKLENTYRLEPEENKKFTSSKTQQAIQDVLECHLKDVRYTPIEAGPLTLDLCAMIKNRVKDLGFDRYKIIVDVVLGQRNDQGLEAASRCIWNTSTDSYASFVYQNESLFAAGTVFGIYFE